MDGNMEHFDAALGTALSPLEIRIGMPHLSAAGLSLEWLLKEACHLHWNRIASGWSAHPSEIRDLDGQRILPSVVACTVNGDPHAFVEDDVCHLMQVVEPTVDNGWRSQADLVTRGKAVRVEIVTSFARRNGPSNRFLESANVEEALIPYYDDKGSKRADVLRLMGRADRVEANSSTSPPHLNTKIEQRHLNGVGLVYFAEIHRMITASELNVTPDLVRAWPMRNRRVHFFANLDEGDTLELTSTTEVQAFTSATAVFVRTFAKRRSDQALVATAEAIFGAPI